MHSESYRAAANLSRRSKNVPIMVKAVLTLIYLLPQYGNMKISKFVIALAMVSTAFCSEIPEGGDGDKQITAPKDLKKTLSGRFSYVDRLKLLEQHGGSPECETAIILSLEWMQKRQNPDGSWEEMHKVAMTGLSLLSYLGHGDVPQSGSVFDGTVQKAIDYLIGVSKKNEGILSEDPKGRSTTYEQGIAVYALAEAYNLCLVDGVEVKGLKEAVLAGTAKIIEGQAENGTWGYRFPAAGDISTTGWCLQALKAVSVSGLSVKGLNESAQKGLVAVAKFQAENGSYKYRMNSKKGGYLTGVGVLCLQQWGLGNSEPASNGIKWAHENVDFKWGGRNLYSHYYLSQAMLEKGGIEWIQYNRKFRDSTIAVQNDEGSFASGKVIGKAVVEKKKKTGGIRKYKDGTDDFALNTEDDSEKTYSWKDHYHNCLSTLMLEVYYRYLPSTQSQDK